MMDSDLSTVDPDSYEAVFICNICNSVLMEPICYNDHSTDTKPELSNIDFESLIKPIVVTNEVTPTRQLKSISKFAPKICAVIPQPIKSPKPSSYLCPTCGGISNDDQCRLKHEFKLIKDICSICGTEYDSLESLMRHSLSCVPVDKCCIESTNVPPISLQFIDHSDDDAKQPGIFNLSKSFASVDEKTLERGQYQVQDTLVDYNSSFMEQKETITENSFDMSLINSDNILEWDESMSLALLDYNNSTNELLFFDDLLGDFPEPEFEKMEVPMNDLENATATGSVHLSESSTENRERLVCDKCSAQFPDMDTFVHHFLSHGNASKYQCQFCSRNYTRLHWFRHHMKTHADRLPLVCKFCDDYFLSTILHDEHLQVVHNFSKEDLENFLKSLNEQQKESFLCIECARWFKSEKDLEIHQKMHQMVQQRITASNANKTIPSHVKSSSPSTSVKPIARNYIKHHEQKQIHIFECNICSVSIRSIDEVRLHLLSHSENRIYKCELCGEEFQADEKLQQHLCTKTTTVLDSFKCKQCDKVFSHAAGLAYHTKTHDREVNVFSCDICPQKFKLLSSYLIHRAKIH